MIDREHDLPIVQQAEALNVSRSSVYYLPRPVPEADLAIMRRLDQLHLEFPFEITHSIAQRSLIVRNRKLPSNSVKQGILPSLNL
jgi:hypothetical protein